MESMSTSGRGCENSVIDPEHVRSYCLNRREQVAAASKIKKLVCQLDEDSKEDISQLLGVASLHARNIQQIPLSPPEKDKLPNFATKTVILVDALSWVVICPEYACLFEFPWEEAKVAPNCALPVRARATRVGSSLLFVQTGEEGDELWTCDVMTGKPQRMDLVMPGLHYCLYREDRILTTCGVLPQLLSSSLGAAAASVVIPMDKEVTHLASSSSRVFVFMEGSNPEIEVRDMDWTLLETLRLRSRITTLDCVELDRGEVFVITTRTRNNVTSIAVREMQPPRRRLGMECSERYSFVVQNNMFVRLEGPYARCVCAVFDFSRMRFGPDIVLEFINKSQE